jgi:preprotein translocase subunit SecB
MADEQAQPTKQLLLQKIYIKDMSFESPKAPDVFRQNLPAQTQLNIRTGNTAIDDQNVEVSLTLTVESKSGEETLFLVELVQAGIFLLQGYSDQERSMLLGSFCPGTLYPFAREAIAEIASKGGFPQLLLQPINFDALYAQAQQERMQQAGGGTAPAAAAPEAAAPEAPPSQGNGGTH